MLLSILSTFKVFLNFIYTIMEKTGHNSILKKYAKYLLDNSSYDDAVVSINKAIAIKPDSKEAGQLLQKTEQLKSNQSK